MPRFVRALTQHTGPPSPRTGSLRGARPADLPVEQPTQFELAINLPPSFRARADRVIE
jgi:hypothetical protein